MHLRLTRGALRVAVFGPGGVGKTTLGQLFSAGQKEYLGARPAAYQESLGMERHGLNAEWDVVGGLMIPPGQERRIATFWPDLYRSLSAGKSSGVINVVSYGYHAFGGNLGFEQSGFDRQGLTAKHLAGYLDARRRVEQNIITELTPRLGDAKRNIWMITLVTKQDLWWNERADVERFYRDGEYGKQIEEITRRRGAQNFAHEYVSASLVSSNFVSREGELLAPTTAGYDDNIRQANLRNLVEQFQALAKRKT